VVYRLEPERLARPVAGRRCRSASAPQARVGSVPAIQVDERPWARVNVLG
jgi:hypothetical protein